MKEKMDTKDGAIFSNKFGKRLTTQASSATSSKDGFKAGLTGGKPCFKAILVLSCCKFINKNCTIL